MIGYNIDRYTTFRLGGLACESPITTGLREMMNLGEDVQLHLQDS